MTTGQNLQQRLVIDGLNEYKDYVVTCLTSKYKEVTEGKTYTCKYSHQGKTGDHWVILKTDSGANRTYKSKYFGVGEYYYLALIDTSHQEFEV